MAFTELDSINFYIGTGTKPTTGVKTGSLLLDTSTSVWYIYDGSAWAQYDFVMR